MARQVRRISELPEAGPLTGDELLEIVQGGDNKRVAVDQLSGGSAPVQSVQGRTGDVVITADDVGLGNVDNTSDANKPVSNAQQAALDEKEQLLVAGTNITIDRTDPNNPIISSTAVGGGGGDVVGPASATDSAVALFDGASGKLLKAGAALGSAAFTASTDYATAAQGAIADSAVQSADLADVATSGAYADLSGLPALGTAAAQDSSAFDPSGAAAAAQAYAIQRANHTGTQAISTVSGLDTALAGKVDSADARLSDSREWTADTISQAEAEAGTSTTRSAWTAQRVRQAIAAWWNTASTPFSRTLMGRTTAAQMRGDFELGNVDNTSDADKPVSTAQQAALNLKLDADANAVSATRLQTARTINGESFDGTANITIPVGITADEWYLGTDKQYTAAAATGATALNLADASTFDLTLTGNVTLSVSNATVPAGYTRSIVVRVRQGATAHTVTWWSGITWLASATPATPSANKTKEYVLSFDGTSWLGREGASN